MPLGQRSPTPQVGFIAGVLQKEPAGHGSSSALSGGQKEPRLHWIGIDEPAGHAVPATHGTADPVVFAHT